MFKWYGILGILMILFTGTNFYFKIEPFASWYFPIIWFGYILTIDAVIYTLKNSSILRNKPKKFLIILIISAAIWWLFEFINYTLGNWHYNTGKETIITTKLHKLIFGTISFATVLPAIIETYDLIKIFHPFSHAHLKKKHKITKRLLYIMIIIGIACLLLTTTYPKYFYYLIWVAFFFILDPLNYLNKQPSIIKHLKDKRLAIPITLFIAGMICGVLWESWNYWAINKWFYDIPFVGFLKIFEMPVLGYLGYGPFAWELYAMYFFVKSLFTRKEKKALFLKRF